MPVFNDVDSCPCLGFQYFTQELKHAILQCQNMTNCNFNHTDYGSSCGTWKSSDNICTEVNFYLLESFGARRKRLYQNLINIFVLKKYLEFILLKYYIFH